MSLIATLGITAGLLQALGYLLYIYFSVRHEVRPNASAWFMFAYGTGLLAALEYEQNAEWNVLMLPVSCAGMGIFVALLCWKRGTLRWPESKVDQTSFLIDVSLTVCYVLAWILRKQEVLTETQVWYATLVFLVGSNLTTFSSFVPIIRDTYQNPQHERKEPWIVWTFAYVILGATTYLGSGWQTTLMLYPVINAPLHGIIAYLAYSHQKQCRDKTVF